MTDALNGKPKTGTGTIDGDTPFTYTVTLTAPDNDMELSDYLTTEYLVYLKTQTGYTAMTYTYTEKTASTRSSYVITIPVSVNGAKTIGGTYTKTVNEVTTTIFSGIPYGTTYTIEETGVPALVGGIVVPLSGEISDKTFNASATGYAEASNTITETITNTFDPKGKLTVKKLNAVTTGSEVPTYHSLDSTADVQFKITLKKATAWKNGDDWNIPEGMTGIPTETATVATVTDPETSTTYYTCTFYKNVPYNATAENNTGVVVLDYVPFDVVEYKVEEVESSAQISGYICKPTGAVESFTSINSSNSAPVVEITNTYTKLASIVLYERVLNGLTNHGTDPFTFTVEIDAPTGVTFTSDYFTFTKSDGTTPLEAANYTVTLPTTFNETDIERGKHATITVNISNSMDHVTIGNVPYGAKFTATGSVDPTVPAPANSSWKLVTQYYGTPDSTSSGARAEGETPDPRVTIVNAVHNFTAKNAITGGMDMQKQTSTTPTPTEGSLTDNLMKNTDFTFTLTLSGVPAGLSLSDFPIGFTGTATDSNSALVNNVSSVSADGSIYTITVKGADTVTILGLPQDVTVTVAEGTMPSANWQQTSVTGTSQNITISDGVANTAAKPVFTNTYTPTGVTLFKQDATSHVGIPSAKFYLLKLELDTDIEDEATKQAFANGTITNGQLTVTKTINEVETEVVLATVVTGITGADANNKLTTTTSSDDEVGLIAVSGNDITITPGDRYFFFEAAAGTTLFDGEVATNYKKDNSLTPAKVITINNAQIDYTVTYDNVRTDTSTEVEVKKTDENGNPLEASIDLWYREISIPPTYTSNQPYVTPSMNTSIKVDGTAPTLTDEEITSSVTVTSQDYTYNTDTVKTASDTDWILPRTDNDYIYFRDYNDGTPGLSDQQSFAGGNQYGVAQNGKRSWLFTRFDNNVQGQQQELDYTHNYWFAAQFTGNGKQMVEYAVWERFVDRYTDDSNRTSDTVVWKIQPPDGYTKVRFCLYDGSQCIRTTKEFTFKLGAIYHKTNWGGSYENQNGKDCYWNVPIEEEAIWSTYKSGSAASTNQKDKRQTSNAGIYQADRYTPTDQKIVFHCNSKVVWHNIHIEFFTDVNNGRTSVDGYYPIGQTFPGYMMEPYAYAGSDYRINGYLTYELTIPEGATHFRVNNGVTKGSGYTHNDYGFYSEITPLKHVEGRKNYGNYFKIGSGRDMTSQPITMTEWTSYTSTGDKWNETYSTVDVDSDYDYVYFEKPSGWNDHIYAYFYGGGDLRKDNWQRACYSVWPGVAPVGTEYVDDNDNTYHSDTYTYSYTGSQYSVSSTSGQINNISPESTFTKGDKTIYKFRIPKGDRTNYKKVIFNDGLQSQGGGHETSVIEYHAGYIYTKSGSSTKHYDSKPTVSYTARGDTDDYIYVKVPVSAQSTWDDLHIKFFNANGTQILQSGVGYVMDYSGKDAIYIYYKVPIPESASKFSVNNGRDKSTTLQTGTYDILRKGASFELSGSVAQTDDFTTGRLVYELNSGNSTLSRTEPNFTQNSSSTTTITNGRQSSGADYLPTTRGDKLYIRNDAPWNIGIGGGKVKFYDANGSRIGTAGTYTLIKASNDDTSDTKDWYYIDIPDNAATFTVTYNDGAYTTSPYRIYTKSASGNPADSDGSYTTGDMYYSTQTGGALTLLNSTDLNPVVSYSYTHRSSGYLYLVCADKNYWQSMKVNFYGTDTVTPIQSDVTPQYLNYISYNAVDPVDGESTSDESAVGYWYRVPIPENAKSFTVTGTNGTSHTTASAEIFPIDTVSIYKKGYTPEPGDMQYRLPSNGTNKPTLLYPVYTEDEVQSVELGDQVVTAVDGLKQADTSQVTDYANAASAELPTHSVTEPTSPAPVLYETGSNTVTYTWEVPGNYIYFDNSVTKWSSNSVYAYFDSDTTTGYPMSQVDSTDVYRLDMSSITGHTTVSFANAGRKMVTASDTLRIGYIYEPNLNSTKYLYVLNSSSNYTIQAWFNTSTHEENGDTFGNDQIKPHANGDRRWTMTDRTKTKFKVKMVDSNRQWSAEHNLKNNGYGEVWRVSGGIETTSTPTLTFVGYVTNTKNDGAYTYTSDGKISLTSKLHTGGGSTASASYQIEDRYGFVEDVTKIADATDKDNFIYITTSLTSPSIQFYSDDGGTTAIASAVSLGYTKVNSTTVTQQTGTTYAIRLPKNARSFKITGTNPSTSASVTSASAIPLYQDVNYTTAGGTIEITGYHHAGTTFTIDTSGAVTGTTLRTGVTTDRQTALTDPLNPKTDADYVFFTDTGSFADSGKVYAYFYGAADGEFAKWPGNVASTASAEPTTYTDNNGHIVYMFRVPKGENGTYSKVIFNNGLTGTDIKITGAADIEPGKNYILGDVLTDGAATPANISYGSFAAGGKVYDVTTEAKASSASTLPYDASGRSNYIYIVNNGTNPLGVDGATTFTLDELHVTFYDVDQQIIGTDLAGYIPDKLTGVNYDGKDVYRIRIPNNAKYFRINNGINKGLDNTDEDTHERERYSEIKEIYISGLYRFVESADITAASLTDTPANYIEGSDVPETAADLYKPNYLLSLVNPLVSDKPETIIRDVKLATVLTDAATGTVKKITWLKPEAADGTTYDLNNPTTHKPNSVDPEYLGNAYSELNNESYTKVKVLKKGTYYWVEKEAPSGYQLNTDKYKFEVKEDGSVYYYDANNLLVQDVAGDEKMVTIINEPLPPSKSEVVLTKTAKEKVGTTDIGATLAGAQFKLVKINADGTTDDTLRFTLVTEDDTNKYTLGSGTHNQSGTWLTTGTDGKLHIFNLAVGDYYLEEMKAPNGYSNKDADGNNRKVYFSVGDNTKTKDITFADEMEPAYIKLYEHINEKRDAWGDPTFVFKIKQTGYAKYKADGTDDGIEPIDNGKEILVALTVDDNGKIADTYKWFNPDGITFSTDAIDDTTYGNWLVEGTTELDDYQGLFNIDSKGRIRVEPGSYEITRLPVSRYEFVTNGKTDAYTNDTEPSDWTAYTDPDTFAASEKMKLEVPKGNTVDVHYYDKVGYYDKFTQVDEEINSFHRYTDTNSVKQEAVKGIRVEDYKVDTNASTTNHDTLDNGTLTVDVKQPTRFKAYFIYADGSEQQITDADDLAKFVVTYTKASESGDKDSFGNAESPAVNDFSYDAADDKITVANYNSYKNGVYTLKATYDGKFSDDFDIVFERAS